MLDDVELGGTSLSALTSRQVRVASAPLATVTELVIEALGRSMGSPSAWQSVVRSSLEPCDLALLGPVFGPDRALVIPDALLPRPETFVVTIADDLARVAATSPDEFVAELDEEGLLGTAWQRAAREPRRWLNAYVSAMERAWTGVAPLWARGAPLLEREIERVAVAVVRHNVDLVLDGMPKGHVAGDRWFPLTQHRPATIAEDLVFVPMLIGPGARLLGSANGQINDLAYPVPGARRLLDTDGSDNGNGARASGLEALLGAPRAALLRILDQPATAGTLAAALQMAHSGITYHVIALERATLVYRERVGSHVYVHRSSRGTALLHLYEP